MELRFGKHKGEEISDVAQHSPDYLNWLLENALDPEDERVLKNGNTYGSANQKVREEIMRVLSNSEDRATAQAFEHGDIDEPVGEEEMDSLF